MKQTHGKLVEETGISFLRKA